MQNALNANPCIFKEAKSFSAEHHANSHILIEITDLISSAFKLYW